MSRLRKDRRPMVYGFGFWLWYILPTIALAGSWLAYFSYRKSHKDMAALNSRRADKMARRRLKKAAAAMKRRDRELFYTELLKALWGYLGDKLKMPTSELMRDNIRQVLEEKGIGKKETDDVIDIIDNAEFARYSSAGAGADMAADYRKSIDAINGLEDSFKNVKK